MTDPADPFLAPERTTVDLLVAADFAEVVNGKLYVMGAAWETFRPPVYPAVMRLAIALAVRVPYLDAGVPHRITLTLMDADGAELVRVDGNLETARPPDSRGDPILVPLAVNAQVEIAGPRSLEHRGPVGAETTGAVAHLHADDKTGVAIAPLGEHLPAKRPDRKSTRLNSSHT